MEARLLMGIRICIDYGFPRFKELKPKFMIVYLGINDALFLVENMEKQHDFSKGRIINDSNRDLIKNEKFLVIQFNI